MAPGVVALVVPTTGGAMLGVVLGIGGAILLLVTLLVLYEHYHHYYYYYCTSNSSTSDGKLVLPPGSMGWPYLGETSELFSQNPNVFFKARQSRYGEIFKTHILGCPSVMLGSPEAVRFVLVNQAHLFKCSFPSSKERMIGPQALFFHEGAYHLKLKRLLHACLRPQTIRSFVPHIEAIALSTLSSWEHLLPTMNTFAQTKKYAFDVGFLSIFGTQCEEECNLINKEELEDAYNILERGYNAMPINIPGTKFHRAIQARKRINDIIRRVILQRRKRGNSDDWSLQKDLLGRLLQYKDEECLLTDQQIADNVIGVIFASRDTTACVFTWLLKFLTDSPSILQSLVAEHEAIRKTKKDDSDPLTWEDTRAMRYTSQAIQETLRIASILSYTFREAVVDVEYKGYVIPKGWKVMPLFRNIHHSSEFFPDPHKFDPSRFQEPPKPNTFLPFGNGIHACPGSELATLEILILVHHLITKFRWDIMGTNNEIQYGPFPIPKAGLPIKLTRTN